MLGNFFLVLSLHYDGLSLTILHLLIFVLIFLSNSIAKITCNSIWFTFSGSINWHKVILLPQLEILELPKDVRPIGIICIGYRAEKPEKLERIDVKALTHYEKYSRKL